MPNFGFVVFNDESSVTECLKKKPIHLPANEFRQEHRLNVEEKKNKSQGAGGVGGGSGSGGSSVTQGNRAFNDNNRGGSQDGAARRDNDR